MREITRETAAAYLRETGRVAAGEQIEVTELSGGVSNLVLLVTLPARGERLVIKQARGKLRVQAQWLCPVERIWREVEVLGICGKLLELRNAGCGMRSEAACGFVPTVPRVLWEDRENYLYAMMAAPPEHQTWKQFLLAGTLQHGGEIAAACGRLLGTLHGGSWQNAEIAVRLDDRTYFDQLRLDPYYRYAAKKHVDLQPQIDNLLSSVWEHRRCLVHGDFSPKNLLAWPGHVMLIDFEVGHYGDPAFDLGFFLTHLVLKSIWSGPQKSEYLTFAAKFWDRYREALAPAISGEELTALETRLLANLAGCLLARIDGKSPVDYLSQPQRETARDLARGWLLRPPPSFAAALAELA